VTVPAPVDEWFSCTLLSGRDAPLTARHAVDGDAAGWLEASERFTFDLLLTELVTNAVTHGMASALAPIQVDCSSLDGTIGVEVTNIGIPFESERGRGLTLVDALSSRWGSRHEDGQTTVWFELAA
jgi:two-component sensor histidine kinase